MANSLELTLEMIGEEKIKSMISGLGLDMKDLKPAMEEVGRGAVKTFSGVVFTSRGQRIGENWPRLSPGYAARKAKRYAGSPVLVRTGAMKSRFTHAADNTSVTISNPDPKFRYHQSSAPRSKIPRRAMIGIYPSLNSDVKRSVAAVIARKIKERSR